jgi:polyisoprenoid-binding protein YceI
MTAEPLAAGQHLHATIADSPSSTSTAAGPTQDVRPAVAPGRWVLDPSRSSATFAVRNFGLKVVHGSVPIRHADAEVSTDGTLTSVHAELALAEVVTGNARRDVDLAKPHLLDTASHPTMSFDGAGSASRVSGVLSVRGRQLPVELRTEVIEGAPGEVRVNASTGFDRSPLGMSVPGFLVGRWVDVTLSVVFTRAPR